MNFPLTLAQQQSNTIQNTYSNYLSQELNRYRTRLNSIFNFSVPVPGEGMTEVAPVDIVAALGVNAGAFFTSLAAHYGYLLAIYPTNGTSGIQVSDAIPGYTINSDGTVTLSA